MGGWKPGKLANNRLRLMSVWKENKLVIELCCSFTLTCIESRVQSINDCVQFAKMFCLYWCVSTATCYTCIQNQIPTCDVNLTGINLVMVLAFFFFHFQQCIGNCDAFCVSKFAESTNRSDFHRNIMLNKVENAKNCFASHFVHLIVVYDYYLFIAFFSTALQ